MKTKDITLTAFGIILLTVSAQISLSIGIVPFTLQILVLSTLAFTFSRKQLCFTITLYVALGIFGFPIFAQGAGGIAMLLNPTFGFILGFIPYAVCINRFKSTLSVIIGYLVLYLFGLITLYFYFIRIQSNITIINLILSFWLPFIPSDLLSIGCAWILKQKLAFKKTM